MFKKPAAEPVHRVTPTEIRTDALKLITLVETEKNECVSFQPSSTEPRSGAVWSARSSRSCPTARGCPTTVRDVPCLCTADARADELIKRPIAIRDIRVRRSRTRGIAYQPQQRLDAGEYPSLAAVKQDLDLMYAGATC